MSQKKVGAKRRNTHSSEGVVIIDRVPIGVTINNVEVKLFRQFQRPSNTISFHIHRNAHELTVIKSGIARQVYLQGEYIGKDGDIFLCPRHIPHLAHGMEQGTADIIVIQFEEPFISLIPEHERYLAPFTILEQRFNPQIPGTTQTSQRIIPLIESMIETPYENTLLRRAYLLQMLSLIYDFYKTEIKEYSHPRCSEEITTVIAHLQQHYTEPHSIESLAKIAHLSRSRFHDAFRNATGTSPVTFLHQYRILVAKKLLLNGMTASEAALASGFNDTSQFSKVFRRFNNCSPKEWQDQTVGRE